MSKKVNFRFNWEDLRWEDLRVLKYSNIDDQNCLRTVSETITNFDEKVEEFTNILIDKMQNQPVIAPKGKIVGLSAVQIGVPVRIFIINTIPQLTEEDAKNKGIDFKHLYDHELYKEGYTNVIEEPTVFINPKIITSGEVIPFNEGCVSLLGISSVVTRPRFVHVKYFDVKGNKCEHKFYGLPSVVVQHEDDHLNGKLFIDHLSEEKKEQLLDKYYEKSAIFEVEKDKDEAKKDKDEVEKDKDEAKKDKDEVKGKDEVKDNNATNTKDELFNQDEKNVNADKDSTGNQLPTEQFVSDNVFEGDSFINDDNVKDILFNIIE